MARKSPEQYEKEFYEIHGDNLTLLETYTKRSEKLKVKCNKCGNIIYKQACKMIGPTPEGCYICSGKNHFKTKETLQDEVDKLYPNKYIIVGEYVKARQPLEIINKKCGHSYYISPDNLLRGKGCAKCTIRQSSYMDLTEEILNKYHIKFEKEKRFKDCKDIRCLPFDYYLEDYNLCIEVDGQFHYLSVGSSFTTKYMNLPEVQRRDKIKTDYCKNNNIGLLRLPYYEKDNFETMIIDTLHINTEVINEISQGSLTP